MTYQEFQEIPGPGLVIALFRWRTGECLTLFAQATDDESLHVKHFCYLVGFGWFDDVWVVEAKKEKFNSLRDRSCLILANISNLM